MNDKLIGGLLIGIGALGAFVVFGSRVSAQAPIAQDVNKRTLHVSGTATIYAQPDSANINVTVSKTADSLTDAKRACDAAIAKVDNALRLQGVKPQDIQTVGYQLYPGTRTVNKKSRRTWTITETYSVHVREITRVSNVLDGAIAAGATNVDQIQFGLDDIAKFRAKARADAVAVAKSKAEGLAKEMGVTLAEPVSIVDQPENGMPTMANMSQSVYYEDREFAPSNSRIRGGQMTTSDRVDIEYAIR